MRTLVSTAILFLLVAQGSRGQEAFNRGRAALAARDTAAAVAAFENAVKGGQKPAESNYYLGAIAYARGTIDDAMRYLEASLRSNDENVDALLLKGDAHLAKNDIAAALQNYRRAQRFASKNLALQIKLGKTLILADSTDAAVIALTRAKMIASNDASVYEGLGDAYSKMGISVMAVQNYEEALKHKPKSLQIQLKLARLHLNNRQYTKALKAFDAATKIDSTYTEAYLEKARIYMRANLFRRAVAPLRTYTRLLPNSFEADTMYIRALLGAGQSAEAARVALRSLQHDSSSVDTWKSYAYALMETKDYENAVNAFAGLQRRNAMSAEDQVKLGKAQLGLKHEDLALKAYEAAVSLDSANCEPFNDLGFLYMKTHEYTKAAAMFEKTIVCDPRTVSAYLNAGACYMVRAAQEQDRTTLLNRAREVLVQAKELNPDNLTIRFRLAQYYAQADSTEQARSEYDAVLKKANENPQKYRKEAGEAYSQIAVYYLSKKQFDRAVENFRRAVESAVENSSIQLNWGLALLQMLDPSAPVAETRKKNEEAVKHFRRAVELDANNAQAHLWLGEGLIRLRIVGDNESIRRLTNEACAEFLKTLGLDPSNQDAKKEIARFGCK